MSKKSQPHSSQLPDKAAHWQTNFTQMKHKAIDYLKKHTHEEMHSIVDAQHYLVLKNNSKNHTNDPSLFCNKLPKEPFVNHHDSRQRGRQIEILNDDLEQKRDSSHIFKNKNKVSSQGGSVHAYEDDFMRVLPPICSVQLQRQQNRQENHREATLKQKLQPRNRLKSNKQQHYGKQANSRRERFRSIEITRNRLAQIHKELRSSSAFHRQIGKYQKMKTQNDKKNIFFLPVAQCLKEHQKEINHAPISTKTSKKNPTRNQQPQNKVEDVIKKQITYVHEQKIPEDNIFTPIIPSQHKKQLHTNTHKRVYAHVKQHRHDTHVLQKQDFQNFVCSPWQNICQQATITNLDVISPEQP